MHSSWAVSQNAHQPTAVELPPSFRWRPCIGYAKHQKLLFYMRINRQLSKSTRNKTELDRLPSTAMPRPAVTLTFDPKI